jgi:hypothetical protein
MEQTKLQDTQKDYAKFLPAISEKVPKTRIPKRFTTGMEGLNFLNLQEGIFTYPWALYSAGHAELDLNKHSPKEDMVRNRDFANNILVGDSGGFQISKGVWLGDWMSPYGVDSKTDAIREKVLRFLEGTFDYSMVLDLPTFSVYDADKHGIDTWQKCLQGTLHNNDFFVQAMDPSHPTKFLNVLQGNNWSQCEAWYDAVKPYSDGTKANFSGWGMGSKNKNDIEIVLRRLIRMREDGLLQEKEWIHYLGTGELLWSCILTSIQRQINDKVNPHMTISYDCASPFLATAYGTIYTSIHTDHLRKNWTYRMLKAIDDKKYSTDTRIFDYNIEFPDKAWESSPISDRIQMNDVCHYGPGDLNKIGKEGKTSWDSFSYALQMGHNVYLHILATQRANEQYDKGIYPKPLVAHNGAHISDVVEDIFAQKTFQGAISEIEKYTRWFDKIAGDTSVTTQNELFGIEPMSKDIIIPKDVLTPEAQYNSLFD